MFFTYFLPFFPPSWTLFICSEITSEVRIREENDATILGYCFSRTAGQAELALNLRRELRADPFGCTHLKPKTVTPLLATN